MKSSFPSHWKQEKLDDVIEALIDYRGKTPKKTSSGVPLVTAKIVKEGNILEPNEFIAPEDYESWMRRGIPNIGDVVLTVEAPLGEVAQLTDKNIALAQRIVTLRGKEGILDNTYLKYFLISPFGQNELKARESGSTVKGIKQSELRKIMVVVPPILEQKNIGKRLHLLDEKIRNNKKMNQTLEKIAQRIFKSWFIDFDPVKANAEGVPFADLSPDIQSLFPSEFVESEMGLIPKGWEVKCIGDIGEVVKGKSYKSSELQNSKTALVTLKSFQRGGGYRTDGYKEYVGKYKDSQIVNNGDLIIAYTDMTQAADVIGKPAMVAGNSEYETLVISLDVGVVRPNNSAMKTFLYCMAMSPRFIDHTKSHSSGTTVMHLGKDAVPSFRFACPPESLIEAFNSAVFPMFERISESIVQNKTLQKTRDRLLPKLLSGSIEIRDVEDKMDEAS